eukprot:2419282-Rhodomonas_salina.2
MRYGGALSTFAGQSTQAEIKRKTPPCQYSWYQQCAFLGLKAVSCGLELPPFPRTSEPVFRGSAVLSSVPVLRKPRSPRSPCGPDPGLKGGAGGPWSGA